MLGMFVARNIVPMGMSILAVVITENTKSHVWVEEALFSIFFRIDISTIQITFGYVRPLMLKEDASDKAVR